MAGQIISAAAIVAEASSVLKSVTEQEKQLMLQWCYTASRRIGSGPQDVKVSDPLYLTDWSATKPTDLSSTIDLALYDSTGSEIVIKYKGKGQFTTSDWLTGTVYSVNDYVVESGRRYKCLEDHTAGTFATDLAASKWLLLSKLSRAHEDIRPYVNALQVSEDDNYFNVESFTDTAPSNAYFVVKYYAFPVDSNGLPRIPESSTLAIIMYIRYMWCLRERRSLGEIQEARQSWLAERNAADAEINTPSMLEGKEIAVGLNSMIQKPHVRSRQY